ncbi:MAG TPA: hypothetical protein VFM93_08905 [Candidatus Limnocylindria bacterium]|nr:hypothetical protein [Candidatus Limnocylindria bacterium]
MLGSGRPQWLDSLGSLAKPDEREMEHLDASSLSARIGVRHEPAAPAAVPAKPTITDGTAPWRKALRTG